MLFQGVEISDTGINMGARNGKIITNLLWRGCMFFTKMKVRKKFDEPISRMKMILKKKARFPKMKSKQNFDEQTWICWVLKMSCCFFDMGARNRKIIKSFSGGIACFSQKWMLEQISISRYREWSWSWKKSSLNFRYGIGSWEFF